MKKHHLIILLLLFIIPGFAQNKSTGSDKQHKVSEKKPEETIQQYFFVMLSKGPNRTQDSATAAKIQEGHLANIKKLYNEGKLKVAGPFGDDGNWRGIFIFDCKTEEEAKQLLMTDPAILSGRLIYEIHPWYTSPIGSFKSGKPE